MVFPTAFAEEQLIDLRDSDHIRQRRPLLIAHRGGVVTPTAPECSLAAIKLAAKRGYAMVELDIQRSRDDVPIVFHDRTLEQACGRQGKVADFTAAELQKIHYVGTVHRIVRLDQALALCRELRLGVMLDLKAGREDGAFLQRIDQLIVARELDHAVVSISGSPQARENLRHVMFTPTDEKMARFRRGQTVDLQGTFWFGLPKDLADEDVHRLQARGAYVFPAINTFRYPENQHRDLARRDIERLTEAGVDGFQIDSIYSDLLSDR
jgi:glycerophosphoryl diester phosphodiesterase